MKLLNLKVKLLLKYKIIELLDYSNVKLLMETDFSHILMTYYHKLKPNKNLKKFTIKFQVLFNKLTKFQYAQ